MRILYHHRTQMDDAQGIHITEMIEAFREIGHEVRMLSLVQARSPAGGEEDGGMVRWIAKYAPKIVYELMEVAYNLYGFLAVVRAIRTYKPDFVYERYSMFTFCGVLACRWLHVPILLEVNSPMYREKMLYDRLVLRGLSRRIENWACDNATRTITVTAVLRDILVKQGARADRMVVMPNGVNPEQFSPSISGARIRRKYGFEDRDTVVGVVGWFREWHGIDFLTGMCHEHGLFADRRVRLMFVGDGPAVPPCRDLVRDLDAAGYVAFTGAVERPAVPEHLAAIDIAVQPRVNDYACPVKVVEYLAMGKAIVAPRQPNILELLTDGEDALLFQPEDRADLYCRVHTLARDRTLVRKVGQGALRTTRSRGLYWVSNARKSTDLVQHQS